MYEPSIKLNSLKKTKLTYFFFMSILKAHKSLHVQHLLFMMMEKQMRHHTF